MITTYQRKLMTIAGAGLLVAIGLFLPLDAFAQNTGVGASGQNLLQQTKQIGVQSTNLAQLLSTGAYIIGVFMWIKALFGLNGFIKAPDDNPITAVMGYAAAGTLLILLPYSIGVIKETLLAKNVTVESSAQSFTDKAAGFN